jgi:hypothetical protein
MDPTGQRQEDPVSTRIAALFVAAALAVLVMLGVALSGLGWLVLGPYVGIVLLGLVVASRQAKALRARQHQAAGRTCQCCTTPVFDPVEIR